MKENRTLTQAWYWHRYLIRCLYLLPSKGLDKELFLAVLPADVAAEARKCFTKGWYVVQDDHRIRPRSPLLFKDTQPTQEQVVAFLEGLYQTLESFVDHESMMEVRTLADKAAELCQQYDRLIHTDSVSSLEAQVLECATPLVCQLRLPRIGGLEHLKEELRNAHNAVGMVYYRHFRSEERQRIQKFHDECGEGICDIFENAMTKVHVTTVLSENLLDIMARYYQLAEMYPEMTAVSEKLYAMQIARKASGWLLSETCQMISDGYLASFASNPAWAQLSSFYQDEAIKYERLAYEELQEEEVQRNE